MIWTIITAVLVFLSSIWLGNKRWIKLEQITGRRFLLTGTLCLILFLALRFLNDIGYFPEELAAGFMANSYSSIAGFFIGAASDQYKMKKDLGRIEYVNTAFISDLLPNLIALTLIILGIARTSIFDQLPISPIRMASGLSLISIGLYAVTLRITPELRKKGFVILDREIPWKDLISYNWYQEEVIELEFKYNETIRIHRSVVTPEDEKKVEQILAKKMISKLEKDQNS
jgi:hypothetical protein